jgi:predicted RNA-binding Zn-ribbon protein involved in translation (DUF1610 family)
VETNLPTVKARVIPEPPPNTRAVFAGDTLTGPFMRGKGSTSYACGLCGNILIQDIIHGQVQNMVFKCPKCKSFNEIP